ncbi:MAG: outer membrane lipoprotein carrier protein LolA [Elusimicrobiota bacterium]|jgi:outer membrane lipoprotein carrier protein|nr:outer membrane lipoprotein carrier protein LolA [Elusimicrobiota bacterium]
MKKTLILLVVFVFSLVSQVSSQSVSALSDILNSMRNNEKQTNSLEVDYKEEILYTSASQKQEINGNLKFLNPKRFFIVQKTPQEQRIYINNNKITVYTPSNAQAIINNWKDVLNSDFTPVSMVNFASNWQTSQKSNSLRYISEDSQNYVLELSPNKEDWAMTLYISKSIFRPIKAILKNSGYIMTIVFSNYKINQITSNNIFNFKAPSGVEIINLD